MRRYAIRYTLEFVVIFMGVLVSFSVQRMSEEKRQAQETERLIYTLTTEIESNLIIAHLKQLRNMAMITILRFDTRVSHCTTQCASIRSQDNGQYRYWTTSCICGW